MSGRPRVLFMADAWDARGGGEVVAAHLARALQNRWEVGVLSTTRGGEALSWEGGVTHYRLHSAYHPRLRPIMSLLNPLVVGKVGEVLRRFRPDVVHAWNVHGHLSYDALRQARGAGVQVVLTYQDAQAFCYTKYKCWVDPGAGCPRRPDYRADPRTCASCRGHWRLFPPRNRLVRAALRRWVSRGVSVSRALATALAQNEITTSDVVYNGLPLDGPALMGASGGRARARHGWDRSPLLVTGGRLHFFKGQRLAISAFARLARRCPEARLVVLGDRSPFRDGLRSLTAELDVAGRVDFPGFLDAPAYHDVLAAADLFLNLSMYLDPFPTVNLETMASAVPVVGSCYGGTPEAVLDGVTGSIVDPYDEEGVAGRALFLLRDGNLRARLGQAGRRRVEQEFEVGRMADRYDAIYRELLAAGGRSSAAFTHG